MTPGPRNYTPSTIKKLSKLSGNKCYNPSCPKGLIGRDQLTNIDKICHIEGASPQGPRYNLNMTDDDRRAFANLILLCDECHSIIDNKVNETQYPVVLLNEWKKDREDYMMEQTMKNPSLLRVAINAISKLDFEDLETGGDNIPFKIKDKIDYNYVKRNKFLIEDNKIYYAKVNSLYEELEKQGSFKKDKLLRNIKNLYLKVKGKYAGDSEDVMGVIRSNADNIIDDIREELLKQLEPITPENISVELDIILVDSFIKCKILEKPLKKDDN